MLRTIAHENKRGLKMHSKKSMNAVRAVKMVQTPSKTTRKPSNFYEKTDKIGKKITKFKSKNRQV